MNLHYDCIKVFVKERLAAGARIMKAAEDVRAELLYRISSALMIRERSNILIS